MEIINKIIEKIGFGKLFFIFTIIIYALIYFLNNNLFYNTTNTFTKTIINIWPTIALVFILTFIINLFLNEKKILKLVGKESGKKGWFIAIFGGLLSHGPIYLWYPLLSDLQKKGMKNELITTFLYNRTVKLPLIPLMIFYFGITFTIVLTFWMLIFSIINGLIVGGLCDENSN
jgi:uncharacterized membrane protein YraQ (UPF0718 family)